MPGRRDAAGRAWAGMAAGSLRRLALLIRVHTDPWEAASFAATVAIMIAADLCPAQTRVFSLAMHAGPAACGDPQARGVPQETREAARNEGALHRGAWPPRGRAPRGGGGGSGAGARLRARLRLRGGRRLGRLLAELDARDLGRQAVQVVLGVRQEAADGLVAPARALLQQLLVRLEVMRLRGAAGRC